MTIDHPKKSSFEPVVDDRTRVIIFGSLPGEESLRRGQYYANPSNQFWRLLDAVLDTNLHESAYQDRLERLLSARIGLWDVVRAARRTGSLDANIRDHQSNDLSALTNTHPDLQAFAFNGAKAYAIGRAQLADTKIELIPLPSSSAAYCAMSFQDKASAWRDTLEKHLR